MLKRYACLMAWLSSVVIGTALCEEIGAPFALKTIEEIPPPLVRKFQSMLYRHAAVRRELKSTLDRSEPNLTYAISFFISQLNKPDVRTRQGAVQALHACGDTRAVPALLNALKDERSSVRREAVTALASVRDARALKPLADLARKRGDDLSSHAERVLFKDYGVTLLNSEQLKHQIYILSKAVKGQDRVSAALALRGTLDPDGVKTLLTALQTDDHYWVRASAARSLGRLGNDVAVQPLIKALEDDGRVAEVAAESLGKIGQPAVEPLANALVHKNAQVRSQAARALEKMGTAVMDTLLLLQRDADPIVRRGVVKALSGVKDKRVIKAIAKASRDSDPEVRKDAIRALIRRKAEGIETLCDIIPVEKDAGNKAMAMHGLERAKTDRAANVLCDVLRNEPSAVLRRKAAWTLNTMGHAAAIEALIQALQKDEDGGVRQNAATALGSVPDPRCTAPLVAVLSDKDPELRECAVIGLKKLADSIPETMNDKATVQALIRMLDETHEQTCQFAVEALGKIGHPDAVEPIMNVLEGCKHPHLRWTTIEALGELRDPRAVDMLVGELSSNVEIKDYAAKALGKIGDARAVSHLMTLLRSRHYDVRQVAAEALGKIGDKRAVDRLIRLLDKKGNPFEQRAVAEALGKIGDLKAVKPLIELVNNPRDVDGMRSEKVIEALGRLGDTRAVPALLTALEHDKLVTAAAKALGQLKDKRAVEPLMKVLPDRFQLWKARANAAEALGNIADPRARSVLQKATKAKFSEIRKASTEALRKIAEQEKSAEK